MKFWVQMQFQWAILYTFIQPQTLLYDLLFSISANNKYFKVIANSDYVSSWKSKGLSAETIKLSATSDNSLTPALSYYGTKTRVKFTGSCLQQPKISYTHGKVVNEQGSQISKLKW